MTNERPKADENALADDADSRKRARVTLSSYSSAALIADAYSTLKSVSVNELQCQLLEQCKRVKGGDLGRAESMLISQAHSLDVIFTRLALDASANSTSHLEAFQIYLKLALRAQSQCRATLETLAAIKNPPLVIARQANIAHGPQQVNNEAGGSRAEQIKKPRTELLEHDDGERLDTRATAEAIGGDQALEAVGALHRTAHGGR